MTTTTNCLEVRRVLGAEPRRRDSAILAHCKTCAACAAFMQEMLALDVRLDRALSIPVPDDLEARIVLDASLKHQRRPRPVAWLALAASLLLAVGISAGVWWKARTELPLAAAVIQHVKNPMEADAIVPGQPLIRKVSLVEGVLDKVGVQVRGGLDDVTYARVCPFRGRLVAHLVVRGKDGPVTVLLLPHIHVNKPQHFDEEGFRGVIEPAGSGSIAILANNPSPMQPMAEELVSKVQWRI
jgi:anti-sigma factor RsiW